MDILKKENAGIAIALIFFGLLLLLKRTGFMSEFDFVYDVKTYPLYLAILFFVVGNYRVAFISLCVFAICHLGFILSLIGDLIGFTWRFLGDLTDFVWPLLLVGAGLLILFKDKFRK